MLFQKSLFTSYTFMVWRRPMKMGSGAVTTYIRQNDLLVTSKWNWSDSITNALLHNCKRSVSSCLHLYDCKPNWSIWSTLFSLIFLHYYGLTFIEIQQANLSNTGGVVPININEFGYKYLFFTLFIHWAIRSCMIFSVNISASLHLTLTVSLYLHYISKTTSIRS